MKKITEKIYIVNALKLAIQAGNPLTSNIILLGVLGKLEGFNITMDQLKQVVPRVVPEKAVEANLKAINIGYNLTL